MPIDCLAGSSSLREEIDAGAGAHDIARSWAPAIDAFQPIRAKFLLY
jgi:hypothetical protein